MKTNRILGVLAASVLGLTTLVGCGQEVDTGHKIVVWTTFNTTYEAVIQKAINNFQSKYPEYKISYSKQNTGYDGLKDMVIKGVSSGDYPDLVVAYPDSVADFIMTGKSLNIEPLMRDEEIGWTDEDFDDIPEAYIEEGSNYVIPGVYSLPCTKSTEAMYYNRDILIDLDLSSIDDEINNGAPLTDEYIQSLTWDELFDKLCPAIMEYNDALPEEQKILKPAADYQETWALVGYDSDDNLFITLAEQYGLPYTSINEATGNGSVDYVVKNDGAFAGVSDEYFNLVKKFTEAYQKKYFTTKGVIGKNVNYVSTTGGMLFSIGSTGGVGYQFSDTTKVDVGVAPIPQASSRVADRKIISQGPSVAFMKRGATQEIIDTRAKGTWLFYKEWMEKDINIEWAMTTGYAPIRNSVATSPAFLTYADETTQELHTLGRLTARNATYVAQNIDHLFSSPVFTGSSKARQSVSGIFADIFKNSAKLDLTTADGLVAFRGVVEKYFQQGYNAAI